MRKKCIHLHWNYLTLRISLFFGLLVVIICNALLHRILGGDKEENKLFCIFCTNLYFSLTHLYFSLTHLYAPPPPPLSRLSVRGGLCSGSAPGDHSDRDHGNGDHSY